MTLVNEETTRKIAVLARLKLSEAEVTRYTAQIAQVLEHVDKIAEVDVEGVEALVYGVELHPFEREDEAKIFPETSDGQPKILENAPKVLQDGFQVPPIL